MAQTWQIVERIVDGATDAAAVVAPDLTLTMHNPPFAAMTGLGRRSLSKKLTENTKIFDLLAAESGVDRSMVKRCFESGRIHRLAEVPVKNARGQQFIVWLSAVPVSTEDGNVVGVVLKYRDVSAEARMQARFKELLALSRARAADLERLVEVRTRELSAAFEEVRRLSRTDPLTGLLNRRAFAELTSGALETAKRHARKAALIMCDLDYFKRVNDHYGHVIGDVVLTSCAQSLRTTFRNIDTVGRFGGEEFIVFLSDVDVEGAVAAAKRCRVGIQDARIDHKMLKTPLTQTASFGVAIYPEHGATLDELISSADQALYAAKETGRNRVVLFGAPGLDSTVTPGVRRRLTSGFGLERKKEQADEEAETERVLVIDPCEERRGRYKSLLQGDYEVSCASTPEEGFKLCRSIQFTVFVADMDQSEHNGLFVLGEILRQQPGAVRILLVENAQPFQQLLGTNLATIDHVLLRDDHTHLTSAIESCKAKRNSYRTYPMARGPQPSRWVLQADELARIVDEGLFDLAYQPIVSCTDKKVFAYEVLCRPDIDSSLGSVDFFDWALREGEIWNLGRQIRRAAMTRLESLANEDVLLFFNLHPAELFDPQLTSREIPLDKYAGRVVFEITERAAIGDFEHMRTAMRHLRQRGYRFAVDDLGAGYAGLNSVAMLQPDFIKVDMTIIRDLDKSSLKARLLKSIIDFAVDERVQVIAEGIETAEEAERVRQLGCHLMQGYHIGRPTIHDPKRRK